MTKRQFRDLVVRAIEDGMVYIMLTVGIWLSLTIMSAILRALGVG